MKMKYLVALLSTCFSLASLNAETIDGVEYQLPSSEHAWKILNEIHNDQCTQFVYFHDTNGETKSQEFFAAHANNLPSDGFDLAGLEKGLQVHFLDQKVDVTILEQSSDSVIYEWSAASQDGQLNAFGWGRGIATPTGTVLLSYQSDQIQERDTLRSIWVPVLKDAKKL